MTRAVLLVVGASLLSTAPVNNGVSFVTDRYYFEMSYGQGMEFYQESYLPGSTIWKLQFRSILRIEIPPAGSAYRGFPIPRLNTANLAWNPSKTLVLATFGEHAIILSPDFQIVRAYRNTSMARWLTDDEISAVVETGGRVSKYETGNFAINVQNDRFRRLGE
jgi:hypothetical protein